MQWGIDEDSIEIVAANMIRYRGYYFDLETGFYYLNSRYYDPNIRRFVSADDISYLGANDDMSAFNLYAYCSNNPVMYKDPTGEIAISTIIGVILIIASVAATANDIYQIASGNVEVIPNDKNEDGVYDEIAINDAYKVITPWMQWGYSFYLNHMREDTKDLIGGTTTGATLEWLEHNAVYHIGSMANGVVNLFKGDSSSIEPYLIATNPTNIGYTIFDNKGSIGKFMIAYTAICSPFTTLIDYIVSECNKK